MEAIRSICSCLRGALRIIVFCVCLVALAVQFFWFYHLKNAHSEVVLPEAFDHWALYAYQWFLMIITLYGLYATFYNEYEHLKWFSIITGVNCLILIVILVKLFGSSGLEDENKKLVQQLEQYASHYNWDLDRSKTVDELTKKSTDSWDMLQYENNCCGLEGIDGATLWDKYRPVNVQADAYPPSCCHYKIDAKTKYCPKEVATKRMGCMTFITLTEGFVSFIGVVIIVISMAQSICAFILSRE